MKKRQTRGMHEVRYESFQPSQVREKPYGAHQPFQVQAGGTLGSEWNGGERYVGDSSGSKHRFSELSADGRRIGELGGPENRR